MTVSPKSNNTFTVGVVAGSDEERQFLAIKDFPFDQTGYTAKTVEPLPPAGKVTTYDIKQDHFGYGILNQYFVTVS